MTKLMTPGLLEWSHKVNHDVSKFVDFYKLVDMYGGSDPPPKLKPKSNSILNSISNSIIKSISNSCRKDGFL